MKITDNWILISGASGGIGKEFAIQLDRMGAALILVGRNEERLNSVLKGLTGPRARESLAISADLSLPGSPRKLYTECKKRGLPVDVLINNAGVGMFGPAIELEEAAIDSMIYLNINALTHLCSLFAGDMLERGYGSILNIGSFAGLNATPYFASYAASKSYVLPYSLALREELKPGGINVSCLLPGYVRTAFDNNAGIENPAYLKFSQSNSLSAEQVARIGIKTLRQKKAWAIAGLKNRLAKNFFAMVPRAVPPKIMKSFLDRMISDKPKDGRQK